MTEQRRAEWYMNYCIELQFRICKTCSVPKHFSEFTPLKSKFTKWPIYARCRECINEDNKKRYQDPVIRVAIHINKAKWAAKVPEKIKKYRKKSYLKTSKDLTDGYIRKVIYNDTSKMTNGVFNIKAKDIPQELIELQRINTKTKRLLIKKAMSDGH